MTDNFDCPLLETSVQLGNSNHEDEAATTSRCKPLILVGLSILFVVAVSTTSYFSYGAGYRKNLNNYSKQDVKEVVSDAHPASSYALEGEADADKFYPNFGPCRKEGDTCVSFLDSCCIFKTGLVCDYLGKSLRSVCQKPKTCIERWRKCGVTKGDCCDGSYCKTIERSREQRCVPGSKPEPPCLKKGRYCGE